MNKVYVLKFNSHQDKCDIEICESKELAIACAKAWVEKYDVEEIRTLEKDGIYYVWGEDNWSYSWGVQIEEKPLFSSVEEFLPSRFLWLRKDSDQ